MHPLGSSKDLSDQKNSIMLSRADASAIDRIRRNPVDTKARSVAEPIVEAIRTEGEAALRRYAVQFGELKEGGKLLLTRNAELKDAYDSISAAERVPRRLEARALVSFIASIDHIGGAVPPDDCRRPAA